MVFEIRKSAVSGYFYPDNPVLLKKQIEKFVHLAEIPHLKPPRALISPHAGYIYSGPIAGYSYKSIVNYKELYKTILLLGPSHYEFVPGLALPTSDYFETPLGNIKINKEKLKILCEFPFVYQNDRAHIKEHSLEVQLPFLQKIFAEQSFDLVPITFGKIPYEEVATAIESIYDNQTLIIVSSDLSHYYEYSIAKILDEKTSQAILNLNPVEISSEQACGRAGIQALIHIAKKRNWKPILLDLRNSGDISGKKSEVVGYGSWAFIEN